jgi:nucleotide-binding universal stress UspA family protein
MIFSFKPYQGVRRGGFMVSKILVPTDGSETAQKAVKYAVNLATQLKASIIVLSIIDNRAIVSYTVASGIAPTGVVEPVENYLRQTAQEHVEEIVRLCDECGVKSEAVIASGHPLEEIVKAATKMEADLIVMGSHGRSALAATVLGSVAYGVIHKETEVPVLIVRRD